MIRIMIGVFMVLHGGVHLLYFGQSARYFDLKAGMLWPDSAWAFSKLLWMAKLKQVEGAT
jgi:hypothetical protein